jgi:hypothetical protein
MPLLPEELKARLPPLYSREAEDDPWVYAKLFLPGTSLSWYVLEGEATSYAGFVLGCFFKGREENSFGHFPESFLEGFRGPNGEVVEQDTSFEGGRLTDVVPAPDV